MASTVGAPAPLFTTAPRIKLTVGTGVNEITIGFAIGMNINVSVNQQPVQIIGKFGPVSIEPTMYNVVTGTMQIIRLASTVNYTAASQYYTDNPGILGAAALAETTAGSDIVQNAVSDFDSDSIASQSGLIRHLDPRTVLLSRSFDVNLRLKLPKSEDVPTQTQINSLLNDNFGDDPTSLPSDFESKLVDVPWMTIQGCRLTSRNVNISLGQMVNEPVSFQGLLATTFNVAEDALMTQD